MRIVNIVTSAFQATYPQRIVIDITWDQPITSYKIENLIFETEQEPGITITGYNAKKDVVAPHAVFLGQTLVAQRNIFLTTPYNMRMSFTVSPFMKGALRVSRQSWNKPLTLEVTNARGIKGDWAPFLSFNVFNNVQCEPYYPNVDVTGTTSIDFNQPIEGQPRLRNRWTYSDPVSQINRFSGLNVKISRTNNFAEQPIVPWDGGNFWWWTSAGCRYSTNPLVYPYGNYYSTNNTADCYGPQGYLWGGYGGLTVTTTQMPVNDALYDHTTIANSYGSKLATNTIGGSDNVYYNWLTQPLLGNDPSNFGGGKNSGLGRMEGWLLANPTGGNPLENMPGSWNEVNPNPGNRFCLAPWKLAEVPDPVPILIQAYYQINWLYSTAAPVN